MHKGRLTLGLVTILAIISGPIEADPRPGASYGGISKAPSYMAPPPPSRSIRPPPGADSQNPARRFGITKPEEPTENPARRFGITKPDEPTQNPPAARFGVSKPNEPTQNPAARFGVSKPEESKAPPPGFGINKPSGVATAPPVLAPRSAADTAIAKGQSKAALAQFDANQAKFKAPPVAAPTSTAAAQASPQWRQYGSRWGSADDYYAARRAAEIRSPQYTEYYRQPPSWVDRPAYGGWAAPFLGGVLLGAVGHAAYDSWAYSHWNDPGVLAWRQDMEQKAKDNAELRQKLDALNARVAELETQNAPKTDKLPDDIDPALVVSEQTALLATTHSGVNWWLWVALIIVMLCIGFMLLARRARHRNPQRFA